MDSGAPGGKQPDTLNWGEANNWSAAVVRYPVLSWNAHHNSIVLEMGPVS